MINIYKDEKFILSTELVQDIVDGIEIKNEDGTYTRLIMDVDYDYIEDLGDIIGYTVHLLDGNTLITRHIEISQKESFLAAFSGDIPKYSDFLKWQEISN